MTIAVHANMPIVRNGHLAFRNTPPISWERRAYGTKPMSDDPSRQQVTGRKPLTPAAQRALAEAEARRQAEAANTTPRAKEFPRPKGPEPTRYGDWENKGIASDF